MNKKIVARVVGPVISFSLIFSPIVGTASTLNSQPRRQDLISGPQLTEKQAKAVVYDAQLSYWSTLDREMPWLTEAFMDQPSMPRPDFFDANDPLNDADPYFMRSQKWVASGQEKCKGPEVCFLKSNGALTLVFPGSSSSLKLDQEFTPVLETSNYLVMLADSDEIFRKKGVEGPADGVGGEGFFYLSKKDIKPGPMGLQRVPIFFFQLPGFGWTNAKMPTLDLQITDQIVLTDNEGIPLQIDVKDIEFLEGVQRQILLLAKTASLLENPKLFGTDILPKAYSTMGFGTVMSGIPIKVAQTPLTAQRNHESRSSQSLLAQALNWFLPRAHAREADVEVSKSRLQSLRESIGKSVKQWATPVLQYGAVAAYGSYMYDPTVVQNLIPENYWTLVSRVGVILGFVAATSVTLKYTLHRDYWRKKYPEDASTGLWQKIHNQHKGIMTELAHGFYFSMVSIGQFTLRIMEVMKDRLVPKNKLGFGIWKRVHKFWEATMGFQIRQATRLPMNWKTQYLGWWHGMLDATLVAVHLLIVAPWLATHLGWGSALTATGAAFASATVLSNFLHYIQSGAFDYSADVKFVYYLPARKEASRKLAAQGIDPEDPENETKLRLATQAELERIYASKGLPGKDEFLYDPIYFFEWVMKKMGYNADSIPFEERKKLGLLSDKEVESVREEEQRKILAGEDVEVYVEGDYFLKSRRWGTIVPAFDRAIEMAKSIHGENPSQEGEQVIKTLQWARKNFGIFGSLLKNMPKSFLQVMKECSRSSRPECKEEGGNTLIKTMVSRLKFFATEPVKQATQVAREIKMLAYLSSSTTHKFEEMAPYIPPSWREQAQSDTVAVAAAELFRDSLMTIYKTNGEAIKQASVVDQQKYRSQAESLFESNLESHPEWRGSKFVREIKVEQHIRSLKAKDKAIDEVRDYKPKESQRVQQSWAEVQEEVESIIVQESSVGQEKCNTWSAMAGKYRESFTGDECQIEEAPWVQANKFRFLVAQKMAKKLGLDVKDVKDSASVQHFVVEASAKTEDEIKQPKNQSYMATLNEVDKRFYEAKLFFQHFVASYVDNSIKADSGADNPYRIDGHSDEYPGRLQKIRQWSVKHGLLGTVVGAGARFVEAFFRNESTSYQPGLSAWIDRNVPMLPDFYHNFMRTVRIFPFVLSLGYMIQYFIWQIQIPYFLYVFGILLVFIHPTLVEVNNRLMQNFSIKPMQDMASKAKYSWNHSHATNIQPILEQNYAEEIDGAFKSIINEPLKTLGSACNALLGRFIGK